MIALVLYRRLLTSSFFQSDAQQLEMAKMTKYGGGIGAPTKEERMKEAANIHIKTGNIRRYCELMVELGQVFSFGKEI